MPGRRSDFRDHLVTLGRKGGKARLTKMNALQRHEVACNAAEARWGKRKTGEPARSSSNLGSSSITSGAKLSGRVSDYPLLIKEPPLRVRLVCDALKQKGFQLADRAWQKGNHAHLECSTMARHVSLDETRDVIIRALRGVGITVIADSIRLLEFGKKLVVPVRLAGSAALSDFVHSSDYHTIEYNGRLYTLPDRAAAMVRFLYETYLQGNPWCSAQAIRNHLQMTGGQRIDHFFRTQDGPQARRDLINSDHLKRRYKINLPELF